MNTSSFRGMHGARTLRVGASTVSVLRHGAWRRQGFAARSALARCMLQTKGKVRAMWYVIQTVGGKEKHARRLMDKLVDGSVLTEAFIPQPRVMHRLRGEWRPTEEVLIPGYVFVRTSNVDALSQDLRSVPAFTRLLGNDDRFIPLTRDEIAFLNAFTKEGDRVIQMSEGIIEGDRVIVLNGPLMDHEGMIKKIDRHKRVAYLDMQMFGRTKTIKVGLEIVRKRS